jgi:peptidyl-prolyl cis-trans isomerase C
MRSPLAATVVLTVLAAAGCRHKPAATDAGPAPASAFEQAPSLPTNIATLPVGTVLARVNGKELTLGQAKREVAERFADASRKLPPDEWARRQPELLQAISEQFVMRTLLLEEADRRGITIDAREASNAFSRIQQQLPEGKNVEQVMKESSMGEARMREEVLVGTRINKLFEAALPQNPVATDKDVADFVAAHPDLKTPETVAASHILIKVEPGDSPAAKKVKRAKLEQIRGKILAGGDFSQLARENSQCPSAARGGVLGVFRRGQMVPEFEAAAFSQKTGEVGDVVETKFGYHLIKITEHKESVPLSPEKVRQVVQKEMGKQAYDAYLAELRNKAKIELGPFLPAKKP